VTKTKRREPMFKGVFAPSMDMGEFLEERGDLRAVFDRVHGHFFDAWTWEYPRRRPRTASKKTGGGPPC